MIMFLSRLTAWVLAGGVCTSALGAEDPCSSQVPVRHRLVMSWVGLNNSPSYLGSASVARDYSKKFGDGFLFAASKQTQNAVDYRGWREKNSKLFFADAKGLDEMGEAAAQEAQAYLKANPGAPPSSFEIVFQISNHGGESVSSRGKSYYVVGDAGRTDPENEKQWLTAGAVGEPQLKAFAKKLPRGIRVKLVAGQCFGADTQDYLLDELKSSCACGVAQAEFGMPSYDIMAPHLTEEVAADYFHNARYQKMWEAQTLKPTAATSLGEAAWEASSVASPEHLGKIGTWGLVGPVLGVGANWGASSSERLMTRVLHNQGSVRSALGLAPNDAVDPERLEINANKIASQNLGNPLVAAEKEILKISAQARRTYVKKLLEIADDAKFDEILEEIKTAYLPAATAAIERSQAATALQNQQIALGSSEKTKSGQAYEKLTNALEEIHPQLYNALEKYDEVRKNLGAKKVMALRILARNKLEEVFYRVASPEEKLRYARFRKCEAESLWTPVSHSPPSGSGEAKSTDH